MLHHVLAKYTYLYLFSMPAYMIEAYLAIHTKVPRPFQLVLSCS